MNTRNAYKVAFQGTLFLLLSFGLMLLAAHGEQFLSRPVAGAFVTLWFVWWILTFAMRPKGVESEISQRHHNWFAALSSVMILALVIGVPWEYSHFNGPLPRDGWLAWSGLAVLALGILLQAAAMWSLSGLYTTHLGIQPGHQLKTSGVYGVVRHPGYLSNLLQLLGVALGMSSLIGLAVLAASTIWVMNRIHSEETMLLQAFGKEYKAYRESTPWKLFPGIY